MLRAGTLVRAWLATAAVDFLFASTLSTVFYGSTFAALWQGVASVLIGPEAMGGGARTVALGLAMHALVAFSWSVVLLFLLDRISWFRALLVSPLGALKVAAIYGPFVWIVMSFVVIQTLTGRPPTIAFRWWVQLLGHVPAVALPMAIVARRAALARRP